MEVSVVVPTLNGRERLRATLTALTDHAPSAEVIVVNGPSADGTTGMVRDRDDVDRLVEVAGRNLNVARNAGIENATGDVIAFVGDDHRITDDWLDGVRDGITSGADAVTGPCRRSVRGGTTSESAERRSTAGQSVTYFNGSNVAFRAGTLRRLDGFDEYLETGAARDAAHRLAGMDGTVVWRTDVTTETQVSAADGGREPAEWGWKYRSLSYRLTKNYGPRPTVFGRVARHAISDGVRAGIGVLRGDGTPSAWAGNGWAVVTGIARGASDGLRARGDDVSHNPNGLRDRDDRVVTVHEPANE